VRVDRVEIFFSVVQRKVVTPNDFHDLTDVEDRLIAFQNRYNFTARPFTWQYTRHDLHDLLKRTAAHDTRTHTPPRNPRRTNDKHHLKIKLNDVVGMGKGQGLPCVETEQGAVAACGRSSRGTRSSADGPPTRWLACPDPPHLFGRRLIGPGSCRCRTRPGHCRDR
jgi:hypothetical protein